MTWIRNGFMIYRIVRLWQRDKITNGSQAVLNRWLFGIDKTGLPVAERSPLQLKVAEQVHYLSEECPHCLGMWIAIFMGRGTGIRGMMASAGINSILWEILMRVENFEQIYSSANSADEGGNYDVADEEETPNPDPELPPWKDRTSWKGWEDWIVKPPEFPEAVPPGSPNVMREIPSPAENFGPFTLRGQLEKPPFISVPRMPDGRPDLRKAFKLPQAVKEAQSLLELMGQRDDIQRVLSQSIAAILQDPETEINGISPETWSAFTSEQLRVSALNQLYSFAIGMMSKGVNIPRKALDEMAQQIREAPPCSCELCNEQGQGLNQQRLDAARDLWQTIEGVDGSND